MGPQTAGAEVKSMAAGGKNAAFNVWASGTINSTEQNYTSSTNAIVKNDSDIRTKVLGGDYAISPTMALGLSLAFDSGDGGSVANPFTSKGYIIAPYFGLQILNDLAADVSFGIGRGEMDMTGNLSTDSDRFFAATNLSYSKWYDNAQLTGKLGYLHAEEKYENTKNNGVEQARTDATNKMEQLRAGVQAGYWLNGFMPYLGLTYVNDTRRSTTQIGATEDPIGRDALQWTAGINFISIANSLTAGLAYSQEQGRTNQDNDVIMANINYRF
ncbi:MAG TPA: hypothetical protein DEQ20_02180 [Desulfobulbaceae bacterium]|nr:hypothetical protein [Desulfobulbaceae bacterium]